MATLGAALLVFIERRGPFRLAAPKTVFSNGHPAQKASERYLLFLRDVRGVVPAGARILVLPGPGTNEMLIPFYYTAVGQLPGQQVVSPLFEFREALPAQYVACYEGECKAAGYREVRRFAAGTFCERSD